MRGIANFRGKTLKILMRIIRWHIGRLKGRAINPLIATFQLTNRCNLRCVMCNIPNNPETGTMPLTLFKNIAEELGGLGCCYASLSGGEILTIPGFHEYIRAAKRHIPSVNMVTNGTLLNEDAAKEIAKSGVDSVAISLDGMERTHEETRGLPGSFEKTINAIALLKRYSPGVKIVVNTVIAPWNLHELHELTEFVSLLGVLHKFQPLNPHPRFEGQMREYPDYGDMEFDREALVAFLRFLLTKKNVANSRYFLASIPQYLFQRAEGGLFDGPCTLPTFFCEFRENGLMYPCLGGAGWRNGYPASNGIRNTVGSPEYAAEVKRLSSCRACRNSLSVCYIEPRVNFPLANFLRYRLLNGAPDSQTHPG